MSDQDQPSVEFVLTAGDQTEKGIKSAENRIGKSVKRIGTMQRKSAKDGEKAAKKGSRGLLRAFGEVEKASAKVFGVHSIAGGITSRFGGVTKAASALGDALGAASVEGEGLSMTVGTLGVAVAGTVGVMAAAAYGAFKLADGWAKGAASIGRTAEIIGVNTQKLQEFAAAAERVGVDKDTATGAVGGLSQTLNDARYGRNPQALAVLARLGVGMKQNSDGTVDVDAMMPAIADAISRQNSSGRRTAARLLGIPEQALPAFTQGGRALSADMADAAKNAPLITDADVTVGKRMQRRHVMAEQRAQRDTITRAGRAAAGGLDTAESWVIGQFSGSVTQDFKPGARQIKDAGDKMSAAASRIEGATVGARSAGRFSSGQVANFARRAVPLKDEAMRYGFSESEASGIAANIELESGGNARQHERGGGSGQGLIQWTDPARKRLFQQVMGVDVAHASRDQQWRFLRWETQHSEAKGWRKATADGQDPAAIAAGFARYVERPKNPDRDSAERAAVAQAIASIPVHVTIEYRNAPPGTTATVRAGAGKPAVSHAIAPVSGR